VQQQQGQPAAALAPAAPAAPVYTGYVASLDVEVVSVLAAAGSSHQLQLWSAESPALYLLVVNLLSHGETLEVEGCQVGSIGWSEVVSPAACMVVLKREKGRGGRDPSSGWGWRSSRQEMLEVEGCQVCLIRGGERL
jgi:hypothetical protein